ncbi:PspA/IM30 family protein [Labrys neptuniae]|uniref:PspA/IM30 family protein n=1 Tax=Labrys neptuniae TaxID=376174 RepID=UPI00288EAC7C|nr:PspA/IM30 family protein [Labrys neptuniae]MDT3381040.1 PspA/IM30 family protein [Labrys neptuniae]
MTGKPDATMVFVLAPTAEDRGALQATLIAYRQAMAILDGTKGANLVALHEEAYEEIRLKTGLPSRMATLALRDHSRRQPGSPIDDIPLDSKLFAVKGPDSVSIATIDGRVVMPYSVSGYHGGWDDFAEARLVFEGPSLRIDVGVQASIHPQKETPMSNEGILARLGRVIAGVVNNAVDTAEAANPTAVAQQAVREIGKIAEEARAALGVAVAAGHRLKAKADDLDAEIRDLDGKIRIGLEKGREDLARAATGVQIDLEAQREALSKAIAENAGEIAEAETTLRSIASARADAQKRLEDAKRAERAAPAAVTPSQRNDQRLADALAAVERVTGVPVKPTTGAAEVEELGQLQRQDAIEARLRAFRDGQR